MFDYGRHCQNFTPRRRLEKLVADGVSDFDDFRRYVSTSIQLYPNMLVTAPPDHIEFWSVTPGSTPAECTVVVRFLVDKDCLDESLAERVTRSAEILQQAAEEEDFVMERHIQRSVDACPDITFLYGRNEGYSRHLHERLERDIQAQVP